MGGSNWAGAAAPVLKSGPLANAVSNGSTVQCLCSSLVFVLHFSDADIEFDFVLMTSAYSQYLKDSCKQDLALIRS